MNPWAPDVQKPGMLCGRTASAHTLPVEEADVEEEVEDDVEGLDAGAGDRVAAATRANVASLRSSITSCA